MCDSLVPPADPSIQACLSGHFGGSKHVETPPSLPSKHAHGEGALFYMVLPKAQDDFLSSSYLCVFWMVYKVLLNCRPRLSRFTELLHFHMWWVLPIMAMFSFSSTAMVALSLWITNSVGASLFGFGTLLHMDNGVSFMRALWVHYRKSFFPLWVQRQELWGVWGQAESRGDILSLFGIQTHTGVSLRWMRPIKYSLTNSAHKLCGYT